MISYTPGGNVNPSVESVNNFMSNLSIISSYVSWNLYTRSSRSLYFTFFYFFKCFILEVPRQDKVWSFIETNPFSTCSTYNSIPF